MRSSRSTAAGPSFHALTERMHVADRRRAQRLAATRPVTLMVFDLLRLFGSDLTGQPGRRDGHCSTGSTSPAGTGRCRRSTTTGPGCSTPTKEQGLEGIVSKRRSAPYAVGRRSPDWRKTAHRSSLSVVVGGWRPEVGSNGGWAPSSSACPTGTVAGATPGAWARASAGSAGEALALRLRPLHRDTSPFADEVPAIDAQGTTWVEPRVVVDVRTLELTGQHRLRQPAYLGVRSDLDPDDLEELDDA